MQGVAAAKLSAEVLKILATPDIDERAPGLRVEACGPRAFGQFLGDGIDRRSR